MKKSKTQYVSPEGKIYNNRKVNQGFPEGMTLKDFRPLALVEVQWDDAPNGWLIIISVDDMSSRYTGDRDFSGFKISYEELEKLNSKFNATRHKRTESIDCVHTQIVSLVAPAAQVMDAILGAYSFYRGAEA